MKKRYLIYFMIFMFVLFVPKVTQAAECSYEVYECTNSENGYLSIANLDHTLSNYCSKYSEYTLKLSGKSGNIYKGTKKLGQWGDFGGQEDLQNWDSSSCPNYVLTLHVSTGYDWYAYDDLSTAEDKASKTKATIIFIRSNLLTELKKNVEAFDTSVGITCPYTKKIGIMEKHFEIDYNPQGYALEARTTDATSAGSGKDYYQISNAMKNKVYLKDPTKCEDVYVELDQQEDVGTMSNPKINNYYMIYADTADCYEDGGDCDKTDGTVSSDNGENKSCSTYEQRFETYSNNYAECVNNYSNLDCEKATNIEIKMKIACENLFKKQTYGDSCLEFCLSLDREIAIVKQTNAKDYNNSQCGFSARVLNWLMKIIKWIRYIVPVLLIILSVMDFIKAVASDSEDEVRKVGAKFVKRLIVAALIFILPLLLDFILGIFNIPVKDFCV